MREIPSHGPVTGAFPESTWGELALTLAAGDTLVLYSDGLSESTSPTGEELGFALEPGQSTVFRHRLLTLPGPISPERAEAAWKAFAAGDSK